MVVDDAGGELGDGVAEGVGEAIRAAAVEEEGAIVVARLDVGGCDAGGVVQEELGRAHAEGGEGDGGFPAVGLEHAGHGDAGADGVAVRADVGGDEDAPEAAEGLDDGLGAPPLAVLGEVGGH